MWGKEWKCLTVFRALQELNPFFSEIVLWIINKETELTQSASDKSLFTKFIKWPLNMTGWVITKHIGSKVNVIGNFLFKNSEQWQSSKYIQSVLLILWIIIIHVITEGTAFECELNVDF